MKEDKSEAEKATEQLFDQLVQMMEDAEGRILNSEEHLPSWVEKELMAVFDDLCALRKKDQEIRQQLGINEHSYQANLAKIQENKGKGTSLLDRIQRLNEDIQKREFELEEEIKAASQQGVLPDNEKEEKGGKKKKIQKRRKKFRGMGGGKGDWMPL